MIVLDKLSKSFEAVKAVDNVSMEIPRGRITIIAGADGAGKSTLFKMLVGLVKMDSGDIFLNGEKTGVDFQKITSITGYMPERFSLYPDLSVEENLNFFSDIYGVPSEIREKRKRELLEKTGMIGFIRRRAGALSGGMKQKLALSSILLNAPEFIILDEPTTGVDPLSRIEFFNIITGLKNEGKTIVMSTPYLDEAEQGDYIVFLKGGRIIGQDSIAKLKAGFPARLYRILPDGNVFDVVKKLNLHREIKNRLYIRGKYLIYMEDSENSCLDLIPSRQTEVKKPSLEDIYLYYERKNG